jgi:hypothetical protein
MDFWRYGLMSNEGRGARSIYPSIHSFNNLKTKGGSRAWTLPVLVKNFWLVGSGWRKITFSAVLPFSTGPPLIFYDESQNYCHA